MKTKIIALIVSSIIFILLAVVLLLPGKDVVIDEIKEMTFNYINGQSIDNISSYYITCEEECTFIYSQGEEEINKEIITNDKLEELEDILNKYDVGSWNGFEENDESVLDGNTFGFSVYMKNGHNIIASGYAKFPKNFYEVKNEIETLFYVKK